MRFRPKVNSSFNLVRSVCFRLGPLPIMKARLPRCISLSAASRRTLSRRQGCRWTPGRSGRCWMVEYAWRAIFQKGTGRKVLSLFFISRMKKRVTRKKFLLVTHFWLLGAQPGRCPAIHDHGLAGHERGLFIIGQEINGMRNLFGFAHPAVDRFAGQVIETR